MRIESDPLQSAIASVMRVLTIVLVVGVAARKLWAMCGILAEWIITLYEKWKGWISDEHP